MNEVGTLIESLLPKKRGKGRLSDPPERDAIDISVSEAVPSGASPGTADGVTSPLVEQTYAGSTYYSLTSSDGLFVYEFPDQTAYIDNNGAGDTITFIHIDPAA